MSLLNTAKDFIPNVLKRSLYFGHQLGDVVLPRLLQKVGLSPVASELAALPITAVGAGAALWFGATNAITPMFGMFASAVFNPMGLAVFAPVFLIFAAVTCVGVGMGDALLKKFGKTPIYDGIYDNLAYRSERKAKLAANASKAKAEETLEQQRKLDAQQAAPAAVATPQGNKAFAGNEPGSEQHPYVGARNAAPSFNNASNGVELTEAGVPKFAGFPPTVDNAQAPRERPERPARPDKP